MTNSSKKLNVDADLNKNRLHFTISKKITKADLDSFYTDLRFCVADLQPNFDVIGDFSECDIMYVNSTPTFKKIMHHLITKRIREKIRVVKDNVFSRQLKNFTLRQQIYEPSYASSLKEAEEHLSKHQRRNGLRIYLRNNQAEYSIGDTKEKSRIINMSTSGCALELGQLQPSVDEETLMKIALKNQESSLEQFNIKSKVVRTNNDLFAVQFLDLDEEKKNTLWNCILCESELMQ